MTIIESISGAILISFLIVVFVSMYYESVARISPSPTLPWVRKKILEELKTRLDPEKSYKIAELGCGWGGINLILAKTFPLSTITGYELSFFPYLFSKYRAKLANNRVNIIKNSFFDENLADYDVVIAYLSPWHMEQLKPQLALLKANSLIISNAFAIPGWVPIETLHTNVGIEIPIYVYRI